MLAWRHSFDLFVERETKTMCLTDIRTPELADVFTSMLWLLPGHTNPSWFAAFLWSCDLRSAGSVTMWHLKKRHDEDLMTSYIWYKQCVRIEGIPHGRSCIQSGRQIPPSNLNCWVWNLVEDVAERFAKSTYFVKALAVAPFRFLTGLVSNGFPSSAAPLRGGRSTGGRDLHRIPCVLDLKVCVSVNFTSNAPALLLLSLKWQRGYQSWMQAAASTCSGHGIKTAQLKVCWEWNMIKAKDLSLSYHSCHTPDDLWTLELRCTMYGRLSARKQFEGVKRKKTWKLLQISTNK